MSALWPVRGLKCGTDRVLLSGGSGWHISGMVRAAKEAGLMVAIDGCPVQCAAKTLQHAEIEPAIQVIVTELGIEKSHEIDVDDKACTQVVKKVKEELAAKKNGETNGISRQEFFSQRKDDVHLRDCIHTLAVLSARVVYASSGRNAGGQSCQSICIAC